MSKERRTATRQHIRWNALIVDPAGSIVAECMVVDVSATGARLVLRQATDVPETFVLVLSKGGGVRRQCELSWFSGATIGVRFIRTAAPENESVSHLGDALSRLTHHEDEAAESEGIGGTGR